MSTSTTFGTRWIAASNPSSFTRFGASDIPSGVRNRECSKSPLQAQLAPRPDHILRLCLHRPRSLSDRLLSRASQLRSEADERCASFCLSTQTEPQWISMGPCRSLCDRYPDFREPVALLCGDRHSG